MKVSTMNLLTQLGFKIQIENNLTADYIDVCLPTRHGKQVVYREHKHLISGNVKKARLPLSKIVKLYVLG